MSLTAAVGATPPRVLVLGGSSEGFAVADALSARGYEVITSFAGRTETRRAPVGFVRIGGFGGRSGLAAYLAVEDIALVVDATHPFANQIQANAVAACAEVNTPLIKIERPAWTPEPGDDWRIVATPKGAARAIPQSDGVCFVTIGRQGIRPFKVRTDIELLFRVIDPPTIPFAHPKASFVMDRGPFTIEAERALFAERRVTCLVAKNSGGNSARAKMIVAREMGIPVVLIERPSVRTGDVFTTVHEAVDAASAVLDAP